MPAVTIPQPGRCRGGDLRKGHPVLVQAGSSPQGRDFAARIAEIVFSIQTRFEDAVAYYADIKNRARQHGRDPRHLTILPGLSLVIGSTEAEVLFLSRVALWLA